MPDIKPFKGWRYNLKKIKNIGTILAPPYDVISKEKQGELYRHSPYNIVRLILGKTSLTDTEENNRWTRARDYLNRWIKEKVFLKDETECIYLYTQRFLFNNQWKTRKGFFALLRLEKGSVISHENTMPAPKKDRLELLRTTKANFEPIFCLYSDKNKNIDAITKQYYKKPVLQIKWEDNTEHKLYIVARKDAIDKIRGIISSQKLLIADGHHRYEAAVQYWKESPVRNESLLNRVNSESPDGFVLVYFTNIDDRALKIFPIHRVVKGIRFDRCIPTLAPFFKIQEQTSLEKLTSCLDKKFKTNVFGIITDKKFYFLRLKNQGFFKKTDTQRKNLRCKRLDTAVLEYRILPFLKSNGIRVDYTHNVHQAVAGVRQKKWDFAVLLQATTIEQVKQIAFSGQKMPRKSTFFYPKPLSGLLIRI